METPENIIKRFKKAIDDNRFSIDIELEMIDILVNKYNPMTVSEVAKKKGVKQPYISKLLKEGKLMYLKFGSQKLIICE